MLHQVRQANTYFHSIWSVSGDLSAAIQGAGAAKIRGSIVLPGTDSTPSAKIPFVFRARLCAMATKPDQR